MMPNKRSGFRLVQEEEDRSQCTGGGVDAGTEEASGAFEERFKRRTEVIAQVEVKMQARRRRLVRSRERCKWRRTEVNAQVEV